MIRPAAALSAFALLLALPTVAHAGGWPQKQGSYYLKLGGSRWTTREAFGLSGVRQPLYADEVNRLSTGTDSLGTSADGSFADTDLGLYGEIGLFDRITVLGNLSFRQLKLSYRDADPTLRDLTTGRPLPQSDPSRQMTRRSTGFGDVSMGVRIGLITEDGWLGPAQLSVQTMFKIPLSDTTAAIPRSNGAGEGDARLQLSVAGRVGAVPTYASVEGGYRVRTGRLANDVVYASEAGVLLAGAVWLRLAAEGATTQAALPERYLVTGPIRPAMTGTVARNQTWHRVQGSVIYKLRPTMDIQLDATHVLSGRATRAGTAFSLGFALHSDR